MLTGELAVNAGVTTANSVYLSRERLMTRFIAYLCMSTCTHVHLYDGVCVC